MEHLSFRITLFFSSFMTSTSVLFCILFLGLSTATNISDDVFLFDSSHAHSSVSRSLLQITKECALNFEFLNYSIITEQCKGPRYSLEKCCPAFKMFACPYADEMNDLTTNCADMMFRYINFNGHYPQGLFVSLCREGKDGLSCTNFTSPYTEADSNVSAASFACCPFSLLLGLIPGFIILMFLM